ncbi:MAG: hypothetical protein ABIG63_21660 [Chloroflexota bacterium]
MKAKRIYLICLFGFVLCYLGFHLFGKPKTVWSASSENAGKMIFTEVNFNDSTNDWVEIYIVDGSVDWTGYRIYEGTTPWITISAALASSLSKGDYIVLHAESGADETTDKGANGYWDLYGLTDLYATDGILQIKEPSGSTDRVDVVIYSDNNGSFISPTQANGAVADGMWDIYDFSTGDAGAWTNSDDIGASQTLSRYLDPGTPVYADSNSKDNWYQATIATKGGGSQQTLIELASFTATVHDGYVLLQWETISEIDNAGFNLWRSASAGGEYVKLNAKLIPAQGGPALGASYTYQDTTVTEGMTYYYKLEDVDTHGVSTLHGPAWVSTGISYRLYIPFIER